MARPFNSFGSRPSWSPATGWTQQAETELPSRIAAFATGAPAVPEHFPLRPPIGVLPLIPPPPGTPLVLPPRTGFTPLSDDDYEAAASRIGCEMRMVRAVAKQESNGVAFDRYNRPAILFEPNNFFALTGRQPQLRSKYPDVTILNMVEKKPVYGDNNVQWHRLQKAYLIHSRAALGACSWGAFQLIGQYTTDNGYASVEQFVAAMCVSEQVQLNAFTTKVLQRKLQQAMLQKDFDVIANRYNGAKGKNTDYAVNLRKRYEDAER